MATVADVMETEEAMTEIRQYLTEEVAEDLADGIITRREAVRRLGLLGVTGVAATGLLATIAAGKAAAAESAIPADHDWFDAAGDRHHDQG